jgi:hypothetical protein
MIRRIDCGLPKLNWRQQFGCAMRQFGCAMRHGRRGQSAYAEVWEISHQDIELQTQIKVRWCRRRQ